MCSDKKIKTEGELKMKKKTSLLAFIITAVMVFSLWPQQVNATGGGNAARTTMADNVTINNWHDTNTLDNSTKNVGRIWTDKSVSAGDVTLTGQDEDSGTATIKKGADSDFLHYLRLPRSQGRLQCHWISYWFLMYREVWMIRWAVLTAPKE